MKYFRGDVKVSEKKDNKKAPAISPIAIEILEICGDELLGYYRVPKDREEALIYLSQRVLLQTPSYGNGQNRKNGYDVDLDEAVTQKAIKILLSAIKDDSRKPTVMAKVISERPLGADMFNRRFKFKVEIRVAEISEDGERRGWNKPFYTKARYGKMKLIPLFDDALRTRVPSVQFNE